MLVSLELKAIADKHGALSSELAVGYRAARIAREEYDSLEGVRAIVCNTTAAHLAVSELLGVDNVSVRDYGRHLYTFCQVSTGSVLHLDAQMEAICLPLSCKAVEDQVLAGESATHLAVTAYHAAVSEVVARVLTDPPDQVFSVRRYRCRAAGDYPDVLCRFVRCERCGTHTRTNRLYDVEGFILCAACAEVEPSWFVENAARK